MRAFVVVTALLAVMATSACHTSRHAVHSGVTLSTIEARAIVASFEAAQASASTALPAPTTTDEALALLKSDRLDAFAAVVAFIDGRSGAARDDATVYADISLTAQVQLAWGEAELMVAEILARNATALEAAVLVREHAGASEAELRADRALVTDWRRTDEALRLLAVDHVDTGARNADGAMGLMPDNYVGYRVAADAARLTNRWSRFEELVARIEVVQPESNGLRFLRGVQAWSQQSNAEEAARHLRDAVDHDPGFIRALAWLVVVAPRGAPQQAALRELAAASPDHQIVRWAGPGILATTTTASTTISTP